MHSAAQRRDPPRSAPLYTGTSGSLDDVSGLSVDQFWQGTYMTLCRLYRQLHGLGEWRPTTGSLFLMSATVRITWPVCRSHAQITWLVAAGRKFKSPADRGTVEISSSRGGLNPQGLRVVVRQAYPGEGGGSEPRQFAEDVVSGTAAAVLGGGGSWVLVLWCGEVPGMTASSEGPPEPRPVTPNV